MHILQNKTLIALAANCNVLNLTLDLRKNDAFIKRENN